MADANLLPFMVQDALLELILDSDELADWNRDLGLPVDRNSERELWVDDHFESDALETLTTLSELDVTGVGDDVMAHESFDVFILAWSRLTDSTAAEVRAEIDGAAAIVETLLRSDPTLSGLVQLAQLSGREYDSGFADAEGKSRQAIVRLKVTCEWYGVPA